MPDYSTVYDTKRVGLIRELVPPGSGLAVDIGCNDGTITKLLDERGYRAVGFDIDPELIKTAGTKYPELEFVDGSTEAAEDLGARSLTLCLEVLEHMDAASQVAFVRSISRATSPGGKLLLSTPGRYSAYSLYERGRHLLKGRKHYDWWDPTHVCVLSFRSLRRLLAEHGFRIERTIGYHYLPLRLSRPLSTEWRLVNRMGFDLIVLAERVPGPPSP